MAAISSFVFEIFACDVAGNISRESASIKKTYLTISILLGRTLAQSRKGAKRYRVSKGFPLRLCAFAGENVSHIGCSIRWIGKYTNFESHE